MTARKRYLPAIAGLGVFILSGAAAVGVANAAPSPSGDGTPVVIDAPPVTVQSYSASDFAAEAKKLPAGLTAALHRDLGVSAAEYLANAAAAKNASDIQDALEAQGVDVLQTALTDGGVSVNVASAADVAAVEATGAKAIVGAPEEKKPAFEVPVPMEQAYDPTAGIGTGAVSGGTWVGLCSLGFNGYSATGAAVNLTSGHCYRGPDDVYHQPVAIPRNTVYENSPGDTSGYLSPLGEKIGTIDFDTKRNEDGSNADSVIVDLASGVNPTPAVSSWGGGDGADVASSIELTGVINGIVGAEVCKSGATSGWTCGNVLVAEEVVDVADHDGPGGHPVNVVRTSVCLLKGDSGGVTVSGSNALGLHAATRFVAAEDDGGAWLPAGSRTCDRNVQAAHMVDVAVAEHWWPDLTREQIQTLITGNLDYYINTGVFAVDSGAVSAKSLYGDNFQLAVVVSDPVVTAPAGPALSDTTITGTLANATKEHGVTVSLDGGAATRVPVDAAGNWSMPVTGLSLGSHTYAVQGVYGAGAYSKSSVVNGSFTVVKVEPVKVTSPTSDAVFDEARTPFVGTAEPGAAVALSIGGSEYGTATVGADGSFTVTPVKDLPYGRYAAAVTETVTSPAITARADVTNLGRKPPAPAVTSAATLKPGATVAGNGLAGATITVSLAGPKAITGTATVAADGTWTWVLPKDAPVGTYTMGVTQTVADLTSAATNSVLTVSASGGSGGLPNTGFGSEPLTIGIIAILVGGVLVGIVIARRRRQAMRVATR